MRSALPAVLGAVLVASPLQAQAATAVSDTVQPVHPVYRIRLYEPWSLRLAPVVRSSFIVPSADSFPLTDEEGRTLQVPRRDVISIDSLTSVTSRGARVRSDVTTGIIFGGAVGAIAGYLSFQDRADGASGSRVGNVAIFAVSGAALGAAIGWVTGSSRSGEQWQRLWSNESAPAR